MRKAEVEKELERAQKTAAKFEKLFVDEQSKSNELRAELALNVRDVKRASFDSLLVEVYRRIDEEIQASADKAAYQWSLTTMRKALRAILA